MGAANNLDALCSKRRPTRKRRLGPSDQRHSEAGAEPDALMRALPAPPVLNNTSGRALCFGRHAA